MQQDLRTPALKHKDGDLPDPAMVKIRTFDDSGNVGDGDDDQALSPRELTSKSITLTKLLKNGVVIDEDDPVLEQ